MNHLSIKEITRIDLFRAVTIVISQFSIPMPYGVPMTLQTFIIPLVAILLGKKEGTLVSVVYVLLGLIGLPVFAGFSGGLAIVLGPTGGFIISFPIMAYLAGMAKESTRFSTSMFWLLMSACANYIVGMFYFSFVTSSSLTVAFTACVLPFIPTAIIKIILIYFVAKKLSPLVLKRVAI